MWTSTTAPLCSLSGFYARIEQALNWFLLTAAFRAKRVREPHVSKLEVAAVGGVHSLVACTPVRSLSARVSDRFKLLK